ncbi:hypothetical protein [Microbulbifer sp.]|uniref:hypothetical protein n=1 Tax=Microbulbifer sp. TaxID=1908541 RepID=UPI003F35197F
MKKLSITLLISVLLGGCESTPTTQISQFGATVDSLAERIDAVYGEYRKSRNEETISTLAMRHLGPLSAEQKRLGLVTAPLSQRDLSQVVTSAERDLKKTTFISQANKYLGVYGKALSQLAATTPRSEIDLAFADFNTALGGLNNSYSELKGEALFEQEDAARNLRYSAMLASLYIDKKRKDALKELVLDADPYIQVICDEIDSALDSSPMAVGIQAFRKAILANEMEAFNFHPHREASAEWRRAEIRRFLELQESASYSKLLVQQAQKSVRAIKKSHAVLAGKLQRDKFSTEQVAYLIGELRELDSHYDDYEELLANCRDLAMDDNGLLECQDVKSSTESQQ